MTPPVYSPQPTASPPDRCTTAQMRALFAAANGRGMSHDDLRALCPHGHVSQLTFPEAAALLNRLNGRKEGYRPRTVGRRRKPRRSPDTFAPLTEEQRDAIDRKFRIAMGWTPPAMLAHLQKKHYASDPTRTMDSILSSADGSGVIEHLKIVLYRTLVYHGRQLHRDVPDPAAKPTGEAIRRMMATLPPTPALSSLLQCRLTELRAAWPTDCSLQPIASFDSWLAAQRIGERPGLPGDGRLLAHVAFCADAAEFVYRIEAKLREISRQGAEPVEPIACSPQSAAEEHNYKFPTQDRQRSAVHATD